uniref:Uncharacterized protein n=1 Tax=Arundo donax TaxID=35708 RepID=A0A0A9C5F2_ARUDO
MRQPCFFFLKIICFINIIFFLGTTLFLVGMLAILLCKFLQSKAVICQMLPLGMIRPE